AGPAEGRSPAAAGTLKTVGPSANKTSSPGNVPAGNPGLPGVLPPLPPAIPTPPYGVSEISGSGGPVTTLLSVHPQSQPVAVDPSKKEKDSLTVQFEKGPDGAELEK